MANLHYGQECKAGRQVVRRMKQSASQVLPDSQQPQNERCLTSNPTKDTRCDTTKLPFAPIAHQLHKAEKPVLIVQNNFPQAGWICRGVLGYIYEVQEQVTLVRYLATVAVRRVLRQRVEGAKVGATRSTS